MTTTSRAHLWIYVLLLAACDSGPIDPETDAGRDAGSPDGGQIPVDAGPLDASALDAGPLDAGPLDAGPLDAGPLDAGPLDAGPLDAGPDAAVAPLDAGRDAGVFTTSCSLEVGPTAGTEADAFTITASTNGTGCAGSVDGGAPIPIPCNDPIVLPGSFFGVGAHTATLLVESGPSGPTSCSASFVVAPATRCAIDVSPPSGPPSTTFTASADSNGSDCRLFVGALDLGSIDCTGTLASSVEALGVGVHTVTLQVGDGPSGPTSCSTTFQVVDGSPIATTCSVSVSPASGPASTTFTGTFDSNGSSCSVSVDSFPLGAVDCVGTFSSSASVLEPGVHTLILSVDSGPSGPTSCSTTFTITPG